jgi:hypothetical protein
VRPFVRVADAGTRATRIRSVDRDEGRRMFTKALCLSMLIFVAVGLLAIPLRNRRRRRDRSRGATRR